MGSGGDTLAGGAGADVLNGGSGIDWASYAIAKAGVNAALDGSFAGTGDAAGDTFLSIERIRGSNFADKLRGDAGANFLVGNNGLDTIDGAAGDDFIAGGRGGDRLTGGAGKDMFDYNAILESTVTAADRDTIVDFNSAGAGTFTDRIDLSTIDAILGGANNAFAFIGGAAFTALGQLRVVQSGGNTFVQANTQGTIAADMQITLTGLHTLGAEDFVL